MSTQESNLELDLVAIEKDEIIPGLPLPSDIYIKLDSGRFICVAKKGSRAALDSLHVSGAVSQYFVLRQEYLQNVEQNLRITELALAKPEIDENKKIQFLQTTTHSVFREIEHMGFERTSFQHAKKTVSAVIQLAGTLDDYLKVINNLADLGGSVLKDSIATASLSVLIAKNMDWKNQRNLEKLALCALLRDVGLKEIPHELISKPRLEMSIEERQLWETHAYRGAEILSRLPEVPSEVIAVALEHHENAFGQGFPRGIKDNSMNPFAKIIALADAFVDLTVAKAKRPALKTSEQAILHLEVTLGLPYNKKAFLALKKALGLIVVEETSTIKVI